MELGVVITELLVADMWLELACLFQATLATCGYLESLILKGF